MDPYLFVCPELPPRTSTKAIQTGKLMRRLTLPARVLAATSKGSDAFDRAFPNLEISRIGPAPARPPFRFLPWLWRDEPDAWSGWSAAASRAVLAEPGRRYRGIVSISTPVSAHLAGLRLKSALGIPWVAFFSDPWVDNCFHERTRGSALVNRHLQRRVMKAADRLVFTSEETLDLVLRRYPRSWRARASVLEHGYDEDLHAAARSAPRADPPVIRSTGKLYGLRTARPLLEGLRRLSARSPELVQKVRFELIGANWSHDSAAGLPKGLVTFRPEVPYEESVRLMASASLLLLIEIAAPSTVFFPSKLADYMGTDVPILGIAPPGPAARLIPQAGGVVCDPNDPEAVARTLGETLERLLAGALSLSPEQRAFRRRYGYDDVARRFEDLLRTL